MRSRDGGEKLSGTPADNLWITPDGYFAVIAPESAAAILEHHEFRVEEISEDMQIMPQDLVCLSVVRGIAGTET